MAERVQLADCHADLWSLVSGYTLKSLRRLTTDLEELGHLRRANRLDVSTTAVDDGWTRRSATSTTTTLRLDGTGRRTQLVEYRHDDGAGLDQTKAAPLEFVPVISATHSYIPWR